MIEIRSGEKENKDLSSETKSKITRSDEHKIEAVTEASSSSQALAPQSQINLNITN